MLKVPSVFKRLWNKFANWLNAKPQPTIYRIVERDISRLTLSEWRSNDALLKQAAKFLNDPQFRMMLDVLRNEHISNQVVSLDAKPEARSALLARIEGYSMALTNLEAMGTQEVQEEALEATFEDEYSHLASKKSIPRRLITTLPKVE